MRQCVSLYDHNSIFAFECCVFDDNQEKLYELKKKRQKTFAHFVHTMDSIVACIESHNCDHNHNHRHKSLVSLKISLSPADAIE